MIRLKVRFDNSILVIRMANLPESAYELLERLDEQPPLVGDR